MCPHSLLCDQTHTLIDIANGVMPNKGIEKLCNMRFEKARGFRTPTELVIVFNHETRPMRCLIGLAGIVAG